MDAKALARLQADPAEFRLALRVDTGADRPQLLGRCLDPWQAKDFGALDAGWQKVAGQRVTADGPVYLRSYWERPRGHSKTADTATMAAYALFASRRAIKGVAAAGTRDQAKFILDAVERLVQLNPWLGELLEVQANRVVNKHTGSELAVIAAEAPTSFGLLVDFILIDEITHWPASGEAFWHSLFSAAGKKPSCLLAIIANAGIGMGTSWQWDVRERFRLAQNFYFSRLDGPVASWISTATLEEQRQILPKLVYDRVWGNLWTTGSSDVWTDEQIDATLTLRGPHESRDYSAVYVGGGDLALRHDAATFCALAKIGTQTHLANFFEWRAPVGGQISLDAIEQTILQAHATYGFHSIGIDPWQAAQLVERLRKRGVPIEERQQTGSKLLEQCTATIELINSRSLALYDYPPLLRDLREARIEERPYGFRFVSSRNAEGHGDRLTSFSIAAAIAKNITGTGGTIELPVGGLMLGGVAFGTDYQFSGRMFGRRF